MIKGVAIIYLILGLMTTFLVHQFTSVAQANGLTLGAKPRH